VLRGGGWKDEAYGCRSANRFGGRPRSTFSYGGFRLAASITSKVDASFLHESNDNMAPEAASTKPATARHMPLDAVFLKITHYDDSLSPFMLATQGRHKHLFKRTGEVAWYTFTMPKQAVISAQDFNTTSNQVLFDLFDATGNQIEAGDFVEHRSHKWYNCKLNAGKHFVRLRCIKTDGTPIEFKLGYW
jgi:hypothetical protein